MSIQVNIDVLGDKRISKEKFNEISKSLNDVIGNELGEGARIQVVLAPEEKVHSKEFFLISDILRLPRMLSYNRIIENPELAQKAKDYKGSINSLVNEIKKIKKTLFQDKKK